MVAGAGLLLGSAGCSETVDLASLLALDPSGVQSLLGGLGSGDANEPNAGGDPNSSLDPNDPNGAEPNNPNDPNVAEPNEPNSLSDPNEPNSLVEPNEPDEPNEPNSGKRGK